MHKKLEKDLMSVRKVGGIGGLVIILMSLTGPINLINIAGLCFGSCGLAIAALTFKYQSRNIFLLCGLIGLAFATSIFLHAFYMSDSVTSGIICGSAVMLGSLGHLKSFKNFNNISIAERQ